MINSKNFLISSFPSISSPASLSSYSTASTPPSVSLFPLSHAWPLLCASSRTFTHACISLTTSITFSYLPATSTAAISATLLLQCILLSWLSSLIAATLLVAILHRDTFSHTHLVRILLTSTCTPSQSYITV